MAAIDPFLLDEQQYHRPDIIQWWVSEGGQAMDENMIHRYFSESPFFDWETKNGITISQSRTVMEAYQRTINRQAFEAELQSRAGVEFIIVGDPQQATDKELLAKGVTTTGIYVIRKQDRRLVKQEDVLDAQRIKHPSLVSIPHPNGRDMWQLTVLGTYFIVGQALYQAPNVFDVVGNHLTSAAASLNKLFDIADALPRYSPAVGHHYLPPRTTTKSTTVSGSVVGTPRSREGSVGVDESSLRSASIQPDPHTTTATDSTSQDSQLLFDSLRLVVQNGDEFTDENPLTGEPGNLRYTTSMAAVKKRRADEEAAAAHARSLKEALKPVKEVQSVFSDPPPKKANKIGKDERRPSKPDKKRKKSRANIGGMATSPTTPKTPGSATTPRPPDSAL